MRGGGALLVGAVLPRKACLVLGGGRGGVRVGWLRVVGGWGRLPRPAAPGRMLLVVLVVPMSTVKPPPWACRCWAVRHCPHSLLVNVAPPRIGRLPRTGCGRTFGPEPG
jgi:hypothetical protein